MKMYKLESDPLYFTVREEHRLRMSDNRVLRRIFGPQTEEVTGGWRRLYNEELHNLYASTSTSSVRMRWVGHVARMAEMINAYSSLVGKSKMKRPLGRHRHEREEMLK
jgi:hypothetical protein